MRPNLGCYRDHFYPEREYKKMHTPNLDALAREGTLFTRAFVSHAICTPSRSCIFAGRRPDSTRVHSAMPKWLRQSNPDIKLLPEVFREAGYWTAGFGKVY